MKKIIALLLAAIFVLSLAACAAKTESDAPATDASQTETTPADAATETETETETASAEPITLKWGSWSFAEDSLKGVYQSMADGYNESNPYNTQINTDYYYSYRIRTEIQETDHIRKEQTGYRTDDQKAVPI